MRTAVMLLAASLGLGCYLAVETFPLQGARPGSLPRDCEVRFFRSPRVPAGRCELIAKVRVRDDGYATRCGTDQVREVVRSAACGVGGDAVVLERLSSSPSERRRDSEMTCVQSNADVYRCDARE